MGNNKQAKKRQPLWKARIPVSEKRNLNLTMWPPYPGSEITAPSIIFDEGRVDKEGNWTHTRIPLAAGRLLELAELIRQAWVEYKRQIAK